MTETKAESQNYLANPYSSLGPLPFDTDEYVLSVLRFRHLFSSLSISFGFMPVTCQTATSEVSFDGQRSPLRLCGWIVLPIRFNSPFPHALHRSPLIPVHIVAH
jgi:hypothetical protein